MQQAFSIHSDNPMLFRHVWKSGPRDRCKVKAPFPPPSTPTVVLPWRIVFFFFFACYWLYMCSICMAIWLGIGVQRKSKLKNGDTDPAKLVGTPPLLAPAS